MRSEDKIFIGIAPIFHTIIFEMKKQRKKLYFFTVIAILIAVLLSYILQLFPEFPLSDTQAEYFSSGLGFISFITLFAACLFFSGIICSEFNKRTGFIVFPKINKYKLILGKYLGNLILVVFIVAVYYFILGLFGFLYYGGPINIRIFYSFGFAVLYVIALSSFVTLFSSFMKNVNVTIITTLIILLMGFNIADQIVTLIFADSFEPLYSLAHLGKLITSILQNPFPDIRYWEISFGGTGPGGFGGHFTVGSWITPSILMGTTLLLVYIVAFFVLAAILFKRRQL
ncbi:MAG: ABC transporter permease [Candidatus Lokiarchaeota archaeon]|nr:ABC transporter permease [Candidatus Lokiarchaeota archaeon]